MNLCSAGRPVANSPCGDSQAILGCVKLIIKASCHRDKMTELKYQVGMTGMVAHTSNPSTQEPEAGSSKFEAGVGCVASPAL